MDTQELLQELRENILRDISDAESPTQSDFLWDTNTLLRYLNEAYFRFARLSKYIQDATTPEATEITLVPGQTEYPLHSSVLEILSARYGDLSLGITKTSVLNGDRRDMASPQPVYTSMKSHPVSIVVPDYELGVLKVAGEPKDSDAGETINLRITRLPLAKLKQNDPGPEIPEHMQLDILEWAAYRALRNHDFDGENVRKASSHRNRFEAAIEEAVEEFRSRTFTDAVFSPSWRW